jgi:glycerol-3-phosphate dehydrogenase
MPESGLQIPGTIQFNAATPVLDPLPADIESILTSTTFTPNQSLRLLARYGEHACSMLKSKPEELTNIPGTNYSWAEIRQAARYVGVVHLDDLLLRRIRLGLLVPNGGIDHLQMIQPIMQTELGWEDERWRTETAAYRKLWESAYCIK